MLWLTGETWLPATSREAADRLAGHYSRRHDLRHGARLGGIGDPAILTTATGSVAVATFQTAAGWHVPWRDWPSWWVGAFRRHPDDAPASQLILALQSELAKRHPGKLYTAVDARHVKSTTPGLVFLRAGWRYHCSTRPFKRSRSLLILAHPGER